MANTRRRTEYSPTIKKKVALDAIAANKTIAQISAEYSVFPARINEWKKHLIANCTQLFENSKISSQVSEVAKKDQQIEKLQQKVGELVIENDFYKKKLIY